VGQPHDRYNVEREKEGNDFSSVIGENLPNRVLSAGKGDVCNGKHQHSYRDSDHSVREVD
jgi:hypothetical protein